MAPDPVPFSKVRDQACAVRGSRYTEECESVCILGLAGQRSFGDWLRSAVNMCTLAAPPRVRALCPLQLVGGCWHYSLSSPALETLRIEEPDRLLPLREPRSGGAGEQKATACAGPLRPDLPSPAPGPKRCGKRILNWSALRGEKSAPRSPAARLPFTPPHPPRQPGWGTELLLTLANGARFLVHRPPPGFSSTVLALDTSAYGGKRNFAVSASRRELPFTSCLGPRKVVLTPALCVSLCGVDPSSL